MCARVFVDHFIFCIFLGGGKDLESAKSIKKDTSSMETDDLDTAIESKPNSDLSSSDLSSNMSGDIKPNIQPPTNGNAERLMQFCCIWLSSCWIQFVDLYLIVYWQNSTNCVYISRIEVFDIAILRILRACFVNCLNVVGFRCKFCLFHNLQCLRMIRRVINILFVFEYQCYKRLLSSLHAHLKGLLGEKKPYS